MRKLQISKSSELPAGFSINKYASTNDFGIGEWVANLEIRMVTAFIISHKRSDPDANYDPVKFTESILEKPIFSGEKIAEGTGANSGASWTLIPAEAGQ